MLGRCLLYVEERNGKLLQYSCLRNPMERGAWWASVHGVTKSQTQLKWLTHTPLRNLKNPVAFTSLRMKCSSGFLQPSPLSRFSLEMQPFWTSPAVLFLLPLHLKTTCLILAFTYCAVKNNGFQIYLHPNPQKLWTSCQEKGAVRAMDGTAGANHLALKWVT